VGFWCAHRTPEKLLIVITDGVILWDDEANDFDWVKTDALPRNLAKIFMYEPHYLDLRWIRTDKIQDLSLNNAAFRDKIADIAATLHGLSKDDIVGKDIEQHRKTKRITWSAVVALALLTITSLGAAWIAWRAEAKATANAVEAKKQEENARGRAEEAKGQKVIAEFQKKQADEQRSVAEQQTKRADEERNIAVSRELATKSSANLLIDPNLSVRQARDAIKAFHTVEAEAALRESLKYSLSHVLDGHTDIVAQAAFSPDGRWVVTASWDQTARVWETGSWEEAAALRGHTGIVAQAAFSPDNQWVVTASADRTARVWEMNTGKEIAVLRGHTAEVRQAMFSPDGRWVVTASKDQSVWLWDANTAEVLKMLRGHTAEFSPDRPADSNGRSGYGAGVGGGYR